MDWRKDAQAKKIRRIARTRLNLAMKHHYSGVATWDCLLRRCFHESCIEKQLLEEKPVGRQH